MRKADALSRRDWLRVAGVAGATGIGLAAPAALGALQTVAKDAPARPAPAARPGSPRDALAALVEGNQRFAQGKASNPHRTLARLQELGTRQQPFAAVLGCADSRVPVEILFDQGFGDIFVARVAGNIAASEMIGSLEYATQILGASVVLVLGHSGCGAVKATIESETVPGQIGSLYPHILPAVDAVKDRHDVDAVVAQNVRNQVRLLRRASPVLAALLAGQKVEVVGGMFDFRTGLVALL